jgi:hypothetical protein
MRKTTVFFVSLLCLTAMGCKPHPDGGGGGGEARHEGGRAGMRKVCGTDLEKFCASDQTGRDRRMCLQSHMDQLSADCKTALSERRQKRHRDRD